MLTYTVVLTPEPDGSAINVRVPAMPGLFTWGPTYEAAIASAREAIVLHLEGYLERGKPMPRDRKMPRKLETEVRHVGRIEEVTGLIDPPIDPAGPQLGVLRRAA